MIVFFFLNELPQRFNRERNAIWISWRWLILARLGRCELCVRYQNHRVILVIVVVIEFHDTAHEGVVDIRLLNRLAIIVML